MTMNLKRKRTQNDIARKSRKIKGDDLEFDEPDDINPTHALAIEEEAVEDNDQSDSGHEIEEWGGVQDSRQAVEDALEESRSGTKPKKPPTGEELRMIKDASDLFKSTSFKLQVDALLPNVRPKASRIPPLERFLFALHALLMGLPSTAAQHPLEASRKLMKKGISIPYVSPLPSEETNWKVSFETPSEITLVGSWANKISVKSKDGLRYGVDLALEMPDSIFQEKDYLNGRFFQKRAFYLATIAGALQSPKCKFNVEVSYESPRNDPRLTKLVIVPKKDDSKIDFTSLNAKICIIPVLSSTSPIPLHRLSPSHSNIRISTDAQPRNHTNIHPPTPLYNSALLQSLSPKPELLATHTLKQESPAFADALTLLRVWANQRGYGEGSKMCVDGFDGRGSWWCALLAFLVAGEQPCEGNKTKRRKPLGRGLSSYQLFRAALDFLSKHNFEEPVFVKTKEGHRFPPEEYKAHHEAAFVDSSSLINLLAGMPLGSLEMLRYDAIMTLEILNQNSPSPSSDPFAEVFLKEHRDLPTRFDTILRVDLPSTKPTELSLEKSMDAGSPFNALISKLNSLIRRGLGDRIKAAATLYPTPSSRLLHQAHPSNTGIIFIGLIHNPENANRLVDHGPAADEQDKSVVQRFRQLWGDKAELRRFKDGRIVESVVWEVKTSDERAHLPAIITRYLLQQHFGLGEDSVQTWQTSFDSLLRLPDVISSKYVGSGISIGFKGALTAFDNLVKSIKGLDDDLPLSLLNVSPTSELLRYTSVFTPVPLPSSLASSFPPNARYLPHIEIILEFEKSSKWPDDLRAIQKIKLAFFERIASALMNAVDKLKAVVVLGDGVVSSEIQDRAYLEIVTPEGWAFAARIWHSREAILLDRILDGTDKRLPHVAPKVKEQKKDRENLEAVAAKEVYTRRFIHGPRHHRAIAALCHQYSAYSGTVRLVKRWFASHWLLRGHISDEAVEILCAFLFVGDGRRIGMDIEVEQTKQSAVPGSKERGFASVIRFLKDWQWENGLTVPLYGPDLGNFSATENEHIHVSGSTAWRIATEVDKAGCIWTSYGPDIVVARRVQTLAQATWDYIQQMENGNMNVQPLFIHPTSDYDFIIKLDPSVLARYHHNVNARPALLSKQKKYVNTNETDRIQLKPGFDPAYSLFSDLERVYTDTFKLFCDPFGGDQLGAVWDPTLKEPRPFRVLGGFSPLLVKNDISKAKDKGIVTLNEEAVLGEIERMGTGLIQKITVHGQSSN